MSYAAGVKGSLAAPGLRGPWAATWPRVRRDRWTVVALCVLVLVILLSLFGGAVASRLLGGVF